MAKPPAERQAGTLRTPGAGLCSLRLPSLALAAGLRPAHLPLPANPGHQN